MRIFVTGGTGLVGSHVIEAAIESGAKVTAIVRRGDAASEPTQLRTRIVQWMQELGVELIDGNLHAITAKHLANQDALIHCAAKVGDRGWPEEFHNINVGGTQQLIDRILALEPQQRPRFVHVSTLGVYPARHHHGSSEQDPVANPALDAYTASKIATESVVQSAMENLEAVILRPGFVYGERDRSVMPPLLKALRGRYLPIVGRGRQILNHTYAGNFAMAALSAASTPAAVGEIFNITDNPVVSRREFYRAICDQTGLPMPIWRTEKWPLQGAAFASRWWAQQRHKEPGWGFSGGRYKFLCLNLHYDISKAQRILAYAPAFDLKAAMARTFARDSLWAPTIPT